MKTKNIQRPALRAAKSIQNKGKMFPYYLEYYPNPQVIGIHTRTRIPELKIGVGRSLKDCVELSRIQDGPRKPMKLHPLYLALNRMKGVKSAWAENGRYGLHVEKANDMFTWPEILPKVLRAVQKHIAGGRKLVEIGRPKQPSMMDMAASRRGRSFLD
jgi:hypothetical protein